MTDHPEWGLPYDIAARAMGRADAELVAAAARGDDDGVLSALRRGAMPNAESMVVGEPMSAVGAAARSGCPDTLACILGAGANPDGTPGEETPPILAAVDGLDRDGPILAEIINLLIDADADPDATDSDGRTALLEAARTGACEIACLLAFRGADPDRPGPGGIAPMDFAERGGELEAAITAGVEARNLGGSAGRGSEGGRRRI